MIGKGKFSGGRGRWLGLFLSFVLFCGVAVTANSAAAETVRVTTARELLEAIAPGADIVVDVADGFFEVRRDEVDAWNASHPYVKLLALRPLEQNGVYDNVRITVRDVDNLTIRGTGNASLYNKSPFAAVLNFENCQNVTLRQLSLGHAVEPGTCGANVLVFNDCRDVTLEKMDLYGSGEHGLAVWGTEDCGKFIVKDSVIRDCSEGPLHIFLSNGPPDLAIRRLGTFVFDNCRFFGSRGGGTVAVENQNIALEFNNCHFELNESLFYLKLDGRGATFNGCHWTVPPDNGGYR